MTRCQSEGITLSELNVSSEMKMKDRVVAKKKDPPKSLMETRPSPCGK